MRQDNIKIHLRNMGYEVAGTGSGPNIFMSTLCSTLHYETVFCAMTVANSAGQLLPGRQTDR